MKALIMMTLGSVICFCSTPCFAEPSDAAKEAIEKARKEKETLLKKREELKDKAASSAANNLSFPGKVVFKGEVSKVTFNANSTSAGTVDFKLANGQILLKTAYGANFIRNKAPIGLNNISFGMSVAIVNPAPAAGKPPLTTCAIGPASLLYFGSDVDNLSKYFPKK